MVQTNQMNTTTSRIILAVAVLAGLDVMPTACSAQDALQCALAKTRFASGEPVLVYCRLVCAQPATGRFVPIDGGNVGAIQLTLLGGDGRELRTGYTNERSLRPQNQDISATGEFADVTDLTALFGDYRVPQGSIADHLHLCSLPIGRYKLLPSISVGTSSLGSPDSIVAVVGKPIEFEVVAPEEEPKTLRLTAAFMRDARFHSWTHQEREDYCRKWLPRFQGSEFFSAVYLMTGPQMADERVDKTIERLRQNGGSALTRALILAFRIRADKARDAAKREVLENVIRSEREGPVVECARTWKERLSQRKGYRSKGR